jgi:probable HAF family extracellular repeat protein
MPRQHIAMATRLFGYLGLALLYGSAVAQQQYSVTEVNSPIPGRFSTASAINGSGAMTGQTYFPNSQPGYENVDAFVYQAGSLRDLGGFHDPSTTPVTNSQGNGISRCGLVAGYSAFNDHDFAFLYANGVMHNLGTLGGSDSIGNGISAVGHVTGWAYIRSKNRKSHAFLYSPDGGMQDIGTLGGDNSQGYGVNESDQITGTAEISGRAPASHAFIYSNGSMQDLGTLYGGNSIGISINTDGHVVGNSDFALPIGTAMHAFFYSNGVMQDITQDTSASSGGTYASSINNFDEIVGQEVDSDGVSRAFLYVNGTMTDLNTLIGSASALYFLQNAVAINDRGQIAVNGSDSTHESVFLLTPLTPSSRVLRDAPVNCQ